MLACLLACCAFDRAINPIALAQVGDLHAVAADVDVLYQTRIQKERFQDRPEDYERARGKFIIDKAMLQLMRQDTVIMHPLPRVDEVWPPSPCLPASCYVHPFETMSWLAIISGLLVMGP